MRLKINKRSFLSSCLGFILVFILVHTKLGVAADNGKIVYLSEESGQTDLYIANADGTDSQRVTNSPADEITPTLSPDGTKIAYQGGNDNSIHIVNIDGTNDTEVLQGIDNGSDSIFYLMPKWSPDGKKLLYVKYNVSVPEYSLYTLELSSNIETRISDAAPAIDFYANWSPDGTKIAYLTAIGGDFGNVKVFLMNSDGSNKHQIASGPATEAQNITWSPDGTKIAFTNENFKITVMDSDGSNQNELPSSGNEYQPSWSRDGTKIAFTSNVSGKDEIYTMNPDGTDKEKLFNKGIIDVTNGYNPVWISNTSIEFTNNTRNLYKTNLDASVQEQLLSDDQTYGNLNLSPDGTKIAFYTDRDGQSEIYVMDADGSNQIRLTNDGGSDTFPIWSPDGTKLLFLSDRDGQNEIYVMDADGSNQTNLTNDISNDDHPSWSPDGTKIVFNTDRDGNNQIYVMDADGSNPTALTASLGYNTDPIWSPDGTKILFSSNRDGDGDLYVMDADGSNPINITNDSFNENNAVWSYDSNKIAFSSNRDGDNEIYVMDADGSNVVQLTDNSTDDYSPIWSPDGTKIAYQGADEDSSTTLFLMNSDGTGKQKLTHRTYSNSSPDLQGTLLAQGDGSDNGGSSGNGSSGGSSGSNGEQEGRLAHTGQNMFMQIFFGLCLVIIGSYTFYQTNRPRKFSIRS